MDVNTRDRGEVIAAVRRGRFGNRPRSWGDYVDFELSGYRGLVSIRCKTPNSPYCKYSIPADLLLSEITAMRQRGARTTDLFFGEMMPDEHLAIQGEVFRSTSGLYLHYSTIPGLPMRVALEPQNSRHAERLTAYRLLQYHLDPSSYDDLIEIMEDHPDCHIEFSTYTRNVGLIPNRNTVIWEVRNY